MTQIQGKFGRGLISGSKESQALACLRISTGLFFLYQGWQKLAAGTHFTHGLSQTLQAWAASNSFPWYKVFLLQVAIPHAALFAQLVTWGEIAIGVSFLLGFAIRFSAPCAILMNLNYLLATQQSRPAALGVNLAFIFISISLFWGNAGHFLGLDQLFQYAGARLSKAKPRKPLSTRRKAKPTKIASPAER
jgi:uncharacterized membrane protein YphA (DoxX/SURF4 family)